LLHKNGRIERWGVGKVAREKKCAISRLHKHRNYYTGLRWWGQNKSGSFCHQRDDLGTRGGRKGTTATSNGVLGKGGGGQAYAGQ